MISKYERHPKCFAVGYLVSGRNQGRSKAFVDDLAAKHKDWKSILKQTYPKLYDQFKLYKPE